MELDCYPACNNFLLGTQQISMRRVVRRCGWCIQLPRCWMGSQGEKDKGLLPLLQAYFWFCSGE